MRVRENLHLDSVTANYGKRTVKYKTSKMWNQLPSSLKALFLVKQFSNALKKFLEVLYINNTV